MFIAVSGAIPLATPAHRANLKVMRALIAILMVILAASPAHSQAGAPGGVLLTIEGGIGPAVAQYVADGIAEAEAAGAPLVVLRIDTPGGLDRSMRGINSAILGARVPIACWVGPSGARAASAGTFILYACPIAAMAPGTNLGAATPVAMGSEMGEAMEAKAVNDAVAAIRSLAELRGRNADWAEKAVRDGASLPAHDALKNSVIDVMADDLPDLLAQLDGRSVTIEGRAVILETEGMVLREAEPSLRIRVLAALGSPEVAYLLMLAGIYGILFELMNPGTILPGTIGAIALLMALYALNLLPVNYTGLALVVLGLGLMVAEAFAPSFGVLGLGGAAAFALGSLMMFDTGVPGFQLSKAVVVGATLTSGLLFVIGIAAAIRSRRGHAVSGGEALIGSRGVVETWQGRSGHVRLGGEMWSARAEFPLAPGDVVRVNGRDGLTLFVETAAVKGSQP